MRKRQHSLPPPRRERESAARLARLRLLQGGRLGRQGERTVFVPRLASPGRSALTTLLVGIAQTHASFDPKYCTCELWDLSSKAGIPPTVEPNSVDVLTLIFCFSALHPDEWAQAVENVYRVRRNRFLCSLLSRFGWLTRPHLLNRCSSPAGSSSSAITGATISPCCGSRRTGTCKTGSTSAATTPASTFSSEVSPSLSAFPILVLRRAVRLTLVPLFADDLAYIFGGVRAKPGDRSESESDTAQSSDVASPHTTSTTTTSTTTTTTTDTTTTTTDTGVSTATEENDADANHTGLPTPGADDTTTIVTESESGELSTSTAPSLSSAFANLSVAPSAVASPSTSRPDSPVARPARGGRGGETLTPYRLDLLQLGVDRRLLLNRKRQIKMFRVWMQGRWRKPLDGAVEEAGQATRAETV